MALTTIQAGKQLTRWVRKYYGEQTCVDVAAAVLGWNFYDTYTRSLWFGELPQPKKHSAVKWQ